MRLPVFVFAFAGVLLLVACSSKPTSTTTPPGGEPVGNTGGDGEPSGEAYSCTADSDCVASCAVREQCCDQLCVPCTTAFHVDELAAHEAWQAEACAEEQCPMAKCMAPTERGVAHCVEGACTVELVPYTPE
jgi:hypothetical protein